ncbi:hypothetical protein ACRYCC_02230 [Actinomadura scrupuli]
MTGIEKGTNLPMQNSSILGMVHHRAHANPHSPLSSKNHLW